MSLTTGAPCRAISWDVAVAVLGLATDARTLPTRLDARVRDVKIVLPSDADDEALEVRLRLDAATVDSAERDACSAVAEALHDEDATAEAAAYPTGSELARWNVGL
jgi:hypothetical protein